jgi:hypothetical protein
MAEAYGILGQSAPSATSLTTVYTCPPNRYAVASSIVVCNQTAADKTFRIAVVKSGAAAASKNYLAYDMTVSANSTVTLQLGVSLGPGDFIQVYISATTVSVSVFGAEVPTS